MSRNLRLSLLAVLAALVSAVPASAQSTTIVISEYRTRGPNGGNDEFIELRNRSAAPVDIGGYRVNGSNGSGLVSTRATIPTGVMLGAGCAYLLANGLGSVAGDQNYGTGIPDDGGIAVLTPGLAIVDQVGQSAGSAYKEGRRSRRRRRTPTRLTSAARRPRTATTTPPTSLCARRPSPRAGAAARRPPATRRRRSRRPTPRTARPRSTRARTCASPSPSRSPRPMRRSSWPARAPRSRSRSPATAPSSRSTPARRFPTTPSAPSPSTPRA